MREDEIDLVGDQDSYKILRCTDADIEAHVGVCRLKLGDRRRQQFARHRLDGGDANLAAHQTA
jgi:hypothetical protein